MQKEPTETPARYIITCPARTGSTMLTTCLQQHPAVCAHGEVFGVGGAPMAFWGVNYAADPPLEQLLVAIRDADPVTFLHDWVFQPGKHTAVGCKVKYEELLLEQYEGLLDALVTDTDVRVIHLGRDNLLERYLSEYVAVNVTKVFNRQKGEVPPPVTVELDPVQVQEDFERVKARRERMTRLFADHRVLELTYEDFVGDIPGTLEQVSKFLDIPHVEIQPLTKRMQRQPPRKAITNFRELRKHFAGTEFEPFFDG